MALSLQLHGDRISSEHPSIDAVSAEVHCDDLADDAGVHVGPVDLEGRARPR